MTNIDQMEDAAGPDPIRLVLGSGNEECATTL